MTVLEPDGAIGSPVATANPDHQPRVPTTGGVPPFCSCGWTSARFPAPGEFLADHLREHDPSYGRRVCGYTMTLKDGTVYKLAGNGAVISRTDGPKGWDYSGKWIIVGFKRRAHSAHTITLAEAAAGEDIGQGWVVDLDHGTLRLWGSPRLRKVAQVTTS